MSRESGPETALREKGFVVKVFDAGSGPDIWEVGRLGGRPMFQGDLDEIQEELDFFFGDSWDVRFLPKEGSTSFQFEVY